MASVLVDFQYLKKLNFAMQQAGMSVVRRCVITNESPVDLPEIQVSLTSDLPFMKCVPVTAERVPANSQLEFKTLQIVPDANYILQLSERVNATILLKITSCGNAIFSQEFPIAILPFSEWTGTEIEPALLSAFVVPNVQALVPVQKRASEILKSWTGTTSLDGYQSHDPQRVVKIAGALYEALRERGLNYITPPASFENDGQKIRLADEVLAQGFGTCLDTSLLYASCLESVGLNPFIMLVKDHAFAGVWLVADSLPHAVMDDLAFILKSLELGDLILVETTMLTGTSQDFNAARSRAEEIADYDNFLCAISVARSRIDGIKPLPVRQLVDGVWQISKDDFEKQKHETPKQIDRYEIGGNAPKKLTKQDIWEQHLLDLSLRNSLLNFRPGKKALALVHSALNLLEDKISDEKEFQIFPKIKSFPPDILAFPRESDQGEFLVNELEKGRLYSDCADAENAAILKTIYRASKLSVEENGANTLYLSLGLLSWKEDKSTVFYNAPILLVPVEMVRKHSQYVIRRRDEETLLNITLLEMLRQKFGISLTINPLPRDESGVDVNQIFAIFRQTLRHKTGWDVFENVFLTNFSFNKFILWNDIHRNIDALSRNKIVQSLIAGRLTWENAELPENAGDLDDKITPSELALPVPADSSQLEAIYAAGEDKSFILHGPPGTGKSQTITNIIANALYHGKRVLFAAEKMAALEVVKTRLDKIGLKNFCLELHSNKARKTDVLNQLKATTEIAKTRAPESFEADAKKLFELRQKLNDYVDALHGESHCKISLYQAIARFCELEDRENEAKNLATDDTDENLKKSVTSVAKNENSVPAEFAFPQKLVENCDPAQIARWRERISELIAAAKNCKIHPAIHPLRELDLPKFSSIIADEIAQKLRAGTDFLNELRERIKKIAEILPIAFPKNRAEFQALEKFVRTLAGTKNFDVDWFLTPNFDKFAREMHDWLARGNVAQKLEDSLSERYDDAIFDVPAAALVEDWSDAEKAFFLKKWLKKSQIKKQFAAHVLAGTPNLPADLLALERFQRLKKGLVKDALLSPMPNSQEKWTSREQTLSETSAILDALKPLANDLREFENLKNSLAENLRAGTETFLGIYGNVLREFLETAEKLNKNNYELNELTRISEFENSTGTVVRALGNGDTLVADSKNYQKVDLNSGDKSVAVPKNENSVPADFISSQISLFSRLLANLDKLKDWYLFTRERHALADENLGEFCDFIAQNPAFPPDSWEPKIRKSFYKTLANFLLNRNEKLVLFRGERFEKIIADFRSRSAEYQSLIRQELFAKLASRLPDFTREASKNPEIALLMRKIESKGRAMSLRQLFDTTPNLLARLCPCMLMSPLSIAQYLDINKHAPFDLVIFDEASQMLTSDAIGAIARGNNLIVVGDPKQMPPTSFFTANTTDEENAELADLESVLDDCLALKMPSKYLQFHYRSKHESLIAFSNTQYYAGKLKTFPSPDNRAKKVSLVKIDGRYDKGKSRQNRAEAEAVVAEILRRLADENLRERSIGVVTFSVAQQNLVEDILLEKFAENPDLERAGTQCAEPIFVKNLESVQGDERDVILFSIGYGPDSRGKISMNFGPLNLAGGERRLNVAASRARYEMMVFSTLSADQIDVARTSAEGVRGLRNFLKFAENGDLAQDSEQLGGNAETIASTIARELRERGFKVDTNIGTSTFKVDIGIIDPANENRYVLGILCDGDFYRQAPTARDREICQPGILRELGWNLLRVWTPDWWENKHRVLDELTEKINQTLADFRSRN